MSLVCIPKYTPNIVSAVTITDFLYSNILLKAAIDKSLANIATFFKLVSAANTDCGIDDCEGLRDGEDKRDGEDGGESCSGFSDGEDKRDGEDGGESCSGFSDGEDERDCEDGGESCSGFSDGEDERDCEDGECDKPKIPASRSSACFFS